MTNKWLRWQQTKMNLPVSLSHCVDTCQMETMKSTKTMMCHSIYLNEGKKINAFRLSKFVEIIGIGWLKTWALKTMVIKMCNFDQKKKQRMKRMLAGGPYLCWRKLSGRLKCLPHTSHEKAISGLLWVRSWIIRLYDLVNRRWQYLHTYSHFGRILRRKSSLSIFNTVNILELLFLCV